jgi:hypothetical protein
MCALTHPLGKFYSNVGITEVYPNCSVIAA